MSQIVDIGTASDQVKDYSMSTFLRIFQQDGTSFFRHK